jgi:hypothetical protein
MKMTVKELIEELKLVPQDKNVEIGTPRVTIGELVRVNVYDGFIELETDEDIE